MFVRAGGPRDLDALLELAALAGPGLTSLPVCRRRLSERLALSEASFARQVDPRDAWYTLVLDGGDGSVAGIGGVRATVGQGRSHPSFRVAGSTLTLAHECDGWSEVGSLFLHPARRGGGAGRLLARARYMLIATAPDLFASMVMAELRGYFAPDGSSPFYEGIARTYYGRPFAEVAGNEALLAEYAPRHPVDTAAAPASARSAIGCVHLDGAGALAMLEREGFAWHGLIDLLDGGPTVCCARDAIATVRSARHAPAGTRLTSGQLAAIPDLSRFRAVWASAETHCDEPWLIS